MLTDKEADAYARTGTFLTLYGWTFDGHQIWRGLLIAFASLIAISFF